MSVFLDVDQSRQANLNRGFETQFSDMMALFTVFLGDIEEVAWEGFDATKVRHIKAIGTDRWSSASQIQRRADEQVRKNLRRTVRELDSLITSNRIDRLLLAGAPELTAELRELLPKRLALLVIGMLHLAIDTPLNNVLDATLPMTEKYERSSEEELATELVTSAAKTGQAVVGLGSTLKKINESRVWQLVYSADFHAPGFNCSKCAALFALERESCVYCSAGLIHVADVVERAVEQAIRKNARIEVVRGEAAASLDNAGGIGAFLKARTKSVMG